MRIEFSIACSECKVFLDCHYWCPHEEAAFALAAAHYPEHYDASQSPVKVTDLDGLPAIWLSVPQLIERISQPHSFFDYIDDQLVMILQRFAKEHQTHSIFLLNDLTDLPWGWYHEHDRWTDWKEVDGPFRSNIYLPRVLVEDLGFRNWEMAQSFLEAENLWSMLEPCPDKVETIKRKFELLVRAG